MNKLLTKLISTGIMLLISLLMVVMTTYAWMTMSGNPEVQGIQVTIGGLNTIMIAPDIPKQVGETVVHYPGTFSEKLDFSRTSGYEYLKDIIGLTPYSTSDGVHWFYPEYCTDAAEYGVPFGELLPLDRLTPDTLLQKANITAETDPSVKGCYVYMDFWVVSPTDNCELRVATGDLESSSFVIDLKDVIKDGDDKFVLQNGTDLVSNAARVGFLVNIDTIDDGSMQEYLMSPSYDNKYRRLAGVYQTPGEAYNSYSTFTIYEPNGDRHGEKNAYVYVGKNYYSTEVYENGSYVVTRPIGLLAGRNALIDISDRLTVQLASRWNKAENGTDDLLDQVFEGFVFGRPEDKRTEEKLFNDFYTEYLQYRYTSYITAGSFINDTSALYNAAFAGVVDADILDRLAKSGATDSVCIATLQKNVPQKIRMYIWIEGQDVDCTASASGKNFAVNIKLAGSNS